MVASFGSLFTPLTSGATLTNTTPVHTPVSGDIVAYSVSARRNSGTEAIPDFIVSANTMAGTWNFTRSQVQTAGGFAHAVFFAVVPATTQVAGTITFSANVTVVAIAPIRWRLTGDRWRDPTYTVVPYNISAQQVDSTTPLLAIDPPGANSVVMGWCNSPVGAGTVVKGALFTEAHNVADATAASLEVEYDISSPPAYADWSGCAATGNSVIVAEIGPPRTAVTKTLDIRRKVYTNASPPELLDSGQPSANSTFVTTAVIDAIPGRDLELWVVTRDNGGVTLPILSLSHSFGGGLTFTQYTTAATNFNHFSLFRARVPVGAGKSAITISITNGLTGTRWGWIVNDVPSIGSVVQSAISVALTVSNPSLNLSAAPAATSYVVSGLINGGALTQATPSDTPIAQVRGTASLPTSLAVQYRTGSTAVAMGWTGANTTQNIIIGFELSQTSTTPVSTTLDIRRAVQNIVPAKAYDIRRAISVPVAKAYDIRRSITVRIAKAYDLRRAIQKIVTPAQTLDIRRGVRNVVAPKSYDIRRAINTQLVSQVIIRRVIIAQIVKPLDIRRSILVPITKAYDLRRSILRPVANSYDIRRSILKIMAPARLLDIRRALLNTVAKSYNIRRAVTVQATNQVIFQRAIVNTVTKPLDVRRSVLGRVLLALDIRRALLNTVPARTLDVRRAILALASRALDVRRGILRTVATTLDIRRTVVAVGQVSTSLDMRRVIIGRVAPRALDIRRAVLVQVAKPVDIRRAIRIEVFNRLNIKRVIINTISCTLDIRRTVTVTVPARSLDIRRSLVILATRQLDIRRSVSGKIVATLTIRRAISVRGPVTALQLQRQIFLQVPPRQLAIFRQIWQAARADLTLRREIAVLYGQPFGLRIDHVIYDFICPTVIEDEIGIYMNLLRDQMQPTVIKAKMGMPQNVRQLV